MWNGHGRYKDHRKGKMMEEKKIVIATKALLTPVKEVLCDIVIPPSLSEIAEADDDAIKKADELLKRGKPAVKGRAGLESIFNVLNGNNDRMFYPGKELDVNINYPTSKADEDQTEYYRNATGKINEVLKKLTCSEKWFNCFYEILESELTYMPGTLSAPDISLFDQAKMCATFALCIADSDKSNEDPFLLYSMDFSGIQDFIYTINSKGALKTLRARSFYLEILMENMIDDVLASIDLPRVNVLYSGGGHCYILLPNDSAVIDKLEEYNQQMNDWLIDTFDISLFVGHGYAPCNADSLWNVPEGSYSELFQRVSRNISLQKTRRYSAKQLLQINTRKNEDYSRECKVCRRLDRLNADNECVICSSIKDFSKDILNDRYYVISENSGGVPLPGGRFLKGYPTSCADGEHSRSYRKRVSDNDGSYGLWIGDYTDYKTLEEMANEAKDKGCIDRIGVIRADVDNLGSTISMGFDKTVGGNIMRTSALSRQLTLFFKYHINSILKCPEFDLGKTYYDRGRCASICYSGGDDLFVVGEWDDIIGFAVDISNAFNRFTQGTLSISGGIGIYDSKYPISRIAYETAELEDLSKKLPGKNAISLLDDGVRRIVSDADGHSFSVSDGTYSWSEFENEVIGDKYQEIHEFFSNSDSRGMSFMYRLLELVRNQSDKINFARFVYVLSRLEPGKDAPPDDKAKYKHLSEKLTAWIKNEKDRRHLKTAMTLYAYMTREEEDKK